MGDEITNLAIFTAGKVAWNLIRGRNPWPYYDPKEAVALRALSLGYGYGDLFPDSLLDKECGPCSK